MTKLLGISGSLRTESVNSKLVREAARLYGEADFKEANIKLPLYNGDDEDRHGLPDNVLNLVSQISDADGVIISTPEYNAGITGVLKNALDWVSRHKPSPWVGKPVVVMSAAAGRAGGIRAQTMLRSCMTSFSVRIVPGSEVAIAGAGSEFDAHGQLISERYTASVERLMQALRREIEA
ncbi:NADPH-dependent FMN reductase [Cognatishimia activa]|uniref:FMN-dependent NADPH-azoreductase n=1 Tax=Cognatishimia activa TaxID=1715691 RepID=A0A0P1IL97_9RHOB|nr:NAD(P)H-dependent oxidoreductase [Cognatishimia activa]CUI54353.1 FMN-dependent NADPH-azoreductase [Cognatishimia activa]CUK24330.1 FMN-dependent NADPH-azoreductase [Cognatishimia activa]